MVLGENLTEFQTSFSLAAQIISSGTCFLAFGTLIFLLYFMADPKVHAGHYSIRRNMQLEIYFICSAFLMKISHTFVDWNTWYIYQTAFNLLFKTMSVVILAGSRPIPNRIEASIATNLSLFSWLNAAFLCLDLLSGQHKLQDLLVAVWIVWVITIPLLIFGFLKDRFFIEPEDILPTISECGDHNMVYLHLQRFKEVARLAEHNPQQWSILVGIVVRIKHHCKEALDPIHALTFKLLADVSAKSYCLKIIHQHIAFEYILALKRFGHDVELRTSYAFFLSAFLKHHNQSLQVVYNTPRSECSTRELYLLHKTQIALEQSAGETIGTEANTAEAKKSVYLDQKTEEIVEKIVSITDRVYDFWTNVSAPHTNLAMTQDLSAQIVASLRELRSEIRKPMYQNVTPLMVAYYRFDKQVLFNENQSDMMMQQIIFKIRSQLANLYKLDNITVDTDLTQTDTELCLLDLSDEKRFEVSSCNASFAKLLNYTREELLHVDFLQCMPRELVSEFKERLYSWEAPQAEGIKNDGGLFAALSTQRANVNVDIPWLFLTKQGFLKELQLSFKRTNDQNDNIIVAIRLKQSPTTSMSMGFLSNRTGIITHFTSSKHSVTRLAVVHDGPPQTHDVYR